MTKNWQSSEQKWLQQHSGEISQFMQTDRSLKVYSRRSKGTLQQPKVEKGKKDWGKFPKQHGSRGEEKAGDFGE